MDATQKVYSLNWRNDKNSLGSTKWIHSHPSQTIGPWCFILIIENVNWTNEKRWIYEFNLDKDENIYITYVIKRTLGESTCNVVVKRNTMRWNKKVNVTIEKRKNISIRRMSDWEYYKIQEKKKKPYLSKVKKCTKRYTTCGIWQKRKFLLGYDKAICTRFFMK